MSERMTFSELFNPGIEGAGFFTSMKNGVAPEEFPSYFVDKEFLLDYGITAYAYGREIGGFYDAIKDIVADDNDMRASMAYETLINFREAWDNIYKSLTADYNPINNYSMTESGEDTRTNTGTQNTSEERSGTETETPNLTNTATGENNSSGGLYGFNSAESVPSDTTHGTNTNTNTQSGTVNTDTSGTTSSLRTDDLTEKNVHTFERSGNIGVTTSQQMIESEIELRKKQFYNIVFHDIINYVCLHVY